MRPLVLSFLCVAAAGASVLAETVSRHVEYSFALQNTKGDVLPVAELWTFAPVGSTSFQTSDSVKTSQPSSIQED